MNKADAYLNGQFMALADAKISPLDRGFLFADSVYEVLCAYSGKPFQAQAHFNRLQSSLHAIHLSNAIDHETYIHIIEGLIEQSDYHHSVIYLQITRGCEPTRNHVPMEMLTPTIFAFIKPYEEKTIAQRAVGFHAMLGKDIRWAHCDIKSTALLANVLAMMEGKANREDCIDVILEKDGFVEEGTASSVFIEKNGQLLTPPLSSYILPGISRQVVIELALSMQVTVNEAPVPTQALFEADNLWLVSTAKEISPVISLNYKPIADSKPSPLWFSFIEAFKKRTIDIE